METQIKLPITIVICFYALGITTLLPWNFFIIADGFWQYKFRNVSLGDDWQSYNNSLTSLQVTFTPTLVIISNVFCTVFLIFTTAIVNRVSEWMRHVGSMGLSLAAMFVVTILTFINTDSWQMLFYIVTMIIVALLNMAVAVFQGSSYGLAGMFPASCMSSMISGQAVAGVFSSLAMIVSILVGGDAVTSAIIFFVIADAFLIFTVACYIYLTKTDYYTEIKANIAKKEEEARQHSVNSDWAAYRIVFKKVWLIGVAYGSTLFITLIIYPAVVVYVTSTSPKSRWTEDFFQPTITFLLFNIGDWLGREAPRFITWPGSNAVMLNIIGGARVIFIPLLMLCFGDNKSFPTIFNHDAYYIVLLFLFAFSSGYVGTIAMIYYPRLVEEEEIELAGTIMAAMLGIGMVVGSLLSPAFVLLWGPA